MSNLTRMPAAVIDNGTGYVAKTCNTKLKSLLN
jgi:hypothetical protein